MLQHFGLQDRILELLLKNNENIFKLKLDGRVLDNFIFLHAMYTVIIVHEMLLEILTEILDDV